MEDRSVLHRVYMARSSVAVLMDHDVCRKLILRMRAAHEDVDGAETLTREGMEGSSSLASLILSRVSIWRPLEASKCII